MIIYMEQTLRLMETEAAQELISVGVVREIEDGVKYLVLES